MNPDQIWLIVCKDIDTGKLYKFKNVTSNELEKERFLNFTTDVTLWIGHNIINYDGVVLNRLVGYDIFSLTSKYIVDTLVVSKLVEYSRPNGHSIAAFGEEFGLEKGQFYKFTDPTLHNAGSILFKQMEDYCVRDVEICHRLYSRLSHYFSNASWKPAIALETAFQRVVNTLHSNGFSFNAKQATRLLDRVIGELNVLDKEILDAYPPRLKLVRVIEPRLTKYDTLNRADFRWVHDGDLSQFNGGPFCRGTWTAFNPASHKQVIEVLHSAGWKPLDKTKTHNETIQEIQRLKYSRDKTKQLDLAALSVKLLRLEKFGWKINENNLSTLPKSAPQGARLLAKRILHESRRRTLTEWIGLCGEDGRVHGDFYAIGAWTHRMAHQRPNMANIPNEFNVHDGSRKLLGKEMRSLWQAPRKRLLVGVDADSIQLRVFAHLINDPDLINAIVRGKKSDKSDPHSFNQKVFGPCCKTRQASKHSLYAIFFGGGPGKIAEIMGCSREEAKDAMERLVQRFPGLAVLQEEVFPRDARRGWFPGLDGRRVPIPGLTVGDREHLCMSGYLQNGEAVIMKMATLKWIDKLKDYNSLLVNLVHDEWQTEVPNDMSTAICIAQIQADSLATVGKELGLNCPLAGSYYDETHHDYTIGTNWSVTH